MTWAAAHRKCGIGLNAVVDSEKQQLGILANPAAHSGKFKQLIFLAATVHPLGIIRIWLVSGGQQGRECNEKANTTCISTPPAVYMLTLHLLRDKSTRSHISFCRLS